LFVAGKILFLSCPLSGKLSAKFKEARAMKVQIGKSALELVEGDITEMETDAIVNAANSRLVLGGGVAGAIRRKGGPQIQQECDRIGGTFVGGAVITTGGSLKARHVIHAVGPQMGEGDEDEKLKNATLNSLKVADENNLKSLSFPAISTGIFGFPMQRCAEIMLSTVVSYLGGRTGLEKVLFCLFGREAYQVFSNQLSREIEK
jgi:O-acetyl-ADP-ribose deacetylase (regulator of RNase III)